MKLKSLILGSVAAAGLSTAGFAADLGVLTSLDVCDSLGISGLTISSSDNCLQISGKVAYEFSFGDYRPAQLTGFTPFGSLDIIGDDGAAGNDWDSKVEAWLKFVGTASSDFGPASATIKLKSIDQARVIDNGPILAVDTQVFEIDEAFVSVGDATTIMAGKKGSIANFGDSTPFNFTGLWASSDVDGTLFDKDADQDEIGGHVIQIVSSLGNGVTVKGGFENLEGTGGTADAGTVVGVLEYAGEGITAHITGFGVGALDGDIDEWGVHAGATATLDMFKVRGAGAFYRNDLTDTDAAHLLASVEGSFDMFKIALSGEYAREDTAGVVDSGFGIGGSIGATVTEGVEINLGGRYFSGDLAGVDYSQSQIAAKIVASVSETITVTGEVGAYFEDNGLAYDNIYYGKAELAWKPGGQFESSIAGEVTSENAYKVTFKASKEFK
jgi:hypothetical protein